MSRTSRGLLNFFLLHKINPLQPLPSGINNQSLHRETVRGSREALRGFLVCTPRTLTDPLCELLRLVFTLIEKIDNCVGIDLNFEYIYKVINTF